jgi:hypothetical protein
MDPIVRCLPHSFSGDLHKPIAAIPHAAESRLPDFSMSLIVCGQSHHFSNNLTP